ncbi:shikimate kinase [Croceicoccus sp. F390]|uniref:Shikimate kinase n=1 Tax=Croceicoccus esteveae TaxID=3075597 RepID=A0ABU2ZG60_9SPHN|nr:shikimate kinase [Croceicoccus sp. F390]MDT0575211.1 shikimate kinase [Croceicoccus sp. F390]
MPSPKDIAQLARRIDRPIVLVGLMGVGKSTVGRRLAHALGMNFVDADEAIVEAAQMPIVDIFQNLGEQGFRAGERRVIARLLRQDSGSSAVIATGGGAFVDPETRRLILDQAIAVWLDSNIDVLVRRVSRRQHRPLLIDRDPRTVLTALAKERGPAYAQAPIRVVSDNGPHSHTVAQILHALLEHTR